MTTQQKRPLLTLTESVNLLLCKCDLPSSLTIEACSSELAMSMTSFRRKLAKEETSYKLIQNKFLNELCVDGLLKHQMNIDELAIKLGYSERATFERAFRQKFGITPSQFRELSQIGSTKKAGQNLAEIAQSMPPMPESCKSLMMEKEKGLLDVDKVVEIVSKDAIFTGRLMGLASKAVYGKTPSNLLEAVSRNLGIDTVINLAVIFGVKDALESQVDKIIIAKYSQAFLIAPSLFRLVRKLITNKIKFDIPLTEQLLVFALLGIFLLSHKSADKHELMLHSMQGIDDLNLLNKHIKDLVDHSIYSASSLMLSLWNFDAAMIKRLTQLERLSQKPKKCNEQDEITLFMLSCLYISAAGHQDYSELEQQALRLNINDFDKIKALLVN